jgi:hypothetical protein
VFPKERRRPPRRTPGAKHRLPICKSGRFGPLDSIHVLDPVTLAEVKGMHDGDEQPQAEPAQTAQVDLLPPPNPGGS